MDIWDTVSGMFLFRKDCLPTRGLEIFFGVMGWAYVVWYTYLILTDIFNVI